MHNVRSHNPQRNRSRIGLELQQKAFAFETVFQLGDATLARGENRVGQRYLHQQSQWVLKLSFREVKVCYIFINFSKALDCCEKMPLLKTPDGSRSQEWYESVQGSLKNARYNRILSIKDYEVRTVGDKDKQKDTFSIQKCVHGDHAQD